MGDAGPLVQSPCMSLCVETRDSPPQTRQRLEFFRQSSSKADKSPQRDRAGARAEPEVAGEEQAGGPGPGEANGPRHPKPGTEPRREPKVDPYSEGKLTLVTSFLRTDPLLTLWVPTSRKNADYAHPDVDNNISFCCT